MTEPHDDEELEVASMIQQDLSDLEHGRNTGEESVMSRIASRDFSDLDLLGSGSEEEDLLI